jgi:hypothetical protein
MLMKHGVVVSEDGRHITGLTADNLDTAATEKVFRRFDNFNDSYNPMVMRVITVCYT